VTIAVASAIAVEVCILVIVVLAETGEVELDLIHDPLPAQSAVCLLDLDPVDYHLEVELVLGALGVEVEGVEAGEDHVLISSSTKSNTSSCWRSTAGLLLALLSKT
jgi:hypothetical protein